MKHILLALALCLGFEATAHAQSADGPFASVTELANYWSAQNMGGSAVQIFHNGHKVHERTGFGPAYIKQYFTCADGNGIRSNCREIFDGFVLLRDAIAIFSPGLSIYVDGVLYRNSSPWYNARIKSCYGDQSFRGRIRYYVVESMYDGFGPQYPGNDCFP